MEVWKQACRISPVLHAYPAHEHLCPSTAETPVDAVLGTIAILREILFLPPSSMLGGSCTMGNLKAPSFIEMFSVSFSRPDYILHVGRPSPKLNYPSHARLPLYVISVMCVPLHRRGTRMQRSGHRLVIQTLARPSVFWRWPLKNCIFPPL